VLGGEPFEEANRQAVLGLLQKAKERYPQKGIWCYTGYDYEKDLLRWTSEGREEVARMLACIDVLVDGEFVEEKKNLRLPFRGSENQRLIDVTASMEQNCVVEFMV